MRSILFRADANPSIGTGDLVSLINLSHYLDSHKWTCYFMIRSYEASLVLSDRINSNHLIVIDQCITVDDEVKQINSVCKKKGIEIIFFEITERPLTKYSGVNKSIKKACVNFNAEILEDLLLVVNWDVDAEQYMKKSIAPKAKYLLGVEYVILPNEFYSLDERSYKSHPEKLLVTMGGADECDVTLDVVKYLIKIKTSLKVNIIVGSAYNNYTKLKSELSASLLDYEIKKDVRSMLYEYLQCDVAIAAGGLTASELVASRTPSILIATYKHQIARCQYFHDRGWATYLGYRKFGDDLAQHILKPVKIKEGSFFNTKKIADEINAI